jgi:hypothetical protein
MPMWFHKLTTAATLVVELIVPWFIAGPRRFRAVAWGALWHYKSGLRLTGNYAFLQPVGQPDSHMTQHGRTDTQV